jgi:predicted Zn-dependent protease
VDLALSLEQAGANAEAEKLYRQILVERPSSVVTLVQLSDLLARMDRGEEALGLLNDSLAKSPDAAGLHRQAGRLLNGAGRGAEAAQHFREYARLAPRARDAQEAVDLAARLEGAATAPSS